MKPTSKVFPTRNVGARMLPVGPSMAATASFEMLLATENSLIFLPLATISFDAGFNKARASGSVSFLLAGVLSRISTLPASRNLDARVQLVQPFL